MTDAPRRTKGILGGRSDDVVRRCLDAAIAELARSGYAAFRMDEVAASAGVNRTTLYRRWKNRKALVTDVIARMRAPFRDNPLPNTGALEKDLVEAFARRSRFSRNVEGRAWARLLDERHTAEVETIVRSAVAERSAEWRRMVSRAIARRELPRGTDEQLLLDLVRAIVDVRRTKQIDTPWLTMAVRTVIAGARAKTLVRRR